MKRSLPIALFMLLLLGAGEDRGKTVVLVISNASPDYLALAAGFKVAFAGDVREINLEGSDEKQRTAGDELQKSPPDLVVAVGDLAAQMAAQRLPGVPLVYCDSMRAATLNPVAGKLYGVYNEPDPTEQLAAMISAFPGKKRIGLIYSAEFARLNADALANGAREKGVSLTAVPLGSIKEVPDKLKALLPQVDLLWVFTDPSILSIHSMQYIVIQSISSGVPIFSGDNGLAHSGATAALVPDMADAGAKAGHEARAVLVGKASSAGDAVVYPKGRLVINLKTAAMLKITFPPELTGKASEVIR